MSINDNYMLLSTNKNKNNDNSTINLLNKISNQLFFTNVMMVGLFGLSIVKPFIIANIRFFFITEFLKNLKETLPDKIIIPISN
jgi:hypothetical protein